MGMAASQARYLALVARKSNCEYEGQQINQARTALANQSANLFNQMLGLQVPVPPSTQDYTKVQYSFKDGMNASTISNWEQLSGADPDYNYVVTHYYYTDQYTGAQKMLNDPQVQFSGNTTDMAGIADVRAMVAAAETELADAKDAVKDAKDRYEDALKELNNKKLEASTLSSYESDIENITTALYDKDTGIFSLTDSNSNSYTYVSYESLDNTPADPPTDPPTLTAKEKADAMINELVEIGALPSSYLTEKTGLCFDINGSNFAYLNDLTNIVKDATGKTDYSGTLITYNSERCSTLNSEINTLSGLLGIEQSAYNGSVERLDNAEIAYNEAIEAYNSLNHPEYIGNCELTPLASLSDDQEAEIRQIITDLKEQGITSDIMDYYYFDEKKGEYVYTGGLYSFKLNGKTYYTTYSDLQNSYLSGTGINNIDGQVKLPYYNATYVSTKIEKTEKALLETDGAGRFTSIRFEDNSITYTLTMETVTDEVAYEDAMNQYLYQNAKYDKMVQDINAKTSIIHQEDRQLELRLKQLETEQSALTAEMDAVQKVVKDNVDKSFKTFS